MGHAHSDGFGCASRRTGLATLRRQPALEGTDDRWRHADVDYASGLEHTARGAARRLRPPVHIAGTPMRWTRPALEIGSSPATWAH